jgi:hypothetical protein
MARRLLLLAALVCTLAVGCATTRPIPSDNGVLPPTVPEPRNGAGNGDSNGKEEKNGKDDKDEPEVKKPPKALFEWAIGKKEEKNGNGEEPTEDRIVTDRPDFTEASSTVGRGRIQLEAGYTFTRDRELGERTNSHSYPEMLWRIGMFADWFELRIGQNFATEGTLTTELVDNTTGADDLYLGVKLALTEQKGWLPETAVILQMTVPTGSNAFSAGEVHPGINLLYGWDIIKDCLSIGGSTQANRARNVIHVGFPEAAEVLLPNHSFVELAQSVTIGYELTRKWGAYTEWFAFFPHSAVGPDIAPEYYFDGGFTYLVNNNFQLDIRGGVGLNKHADDYFVGSGFAVRY